MIVFKTFLKVLNKCKGIILLYTIILLIFAGFNMKNKDTVNTFQAEKPDVAIILEDENTGITKNLVEFLEANMNRKKIEESKIKDALFYRDINLMIKIPKNYRIDVLNGKTPEIEIKSTEDYQASLGKMLLEKYLRVQSIYQTEYQEEKILLEKINETVKKSVDLSITSKRDTTALQNAKFYFNFSNYAILAGLVYVVCMILSIFKNKDIHKRTTISSMNYKKYNRILFLANSLLAIFLWFLYILLSFIFVGPIMFSFYGILFMINTLIFSICALSIAFFIGSVINNKEAVSGIVNVVALGSSFLCGAFVPTEFLPKSVLLFAHILPSYWFINTSEKIATLENLEFTSLKPLFINMLILLIFIGIFTILTNWVSKKKRQSE